MRRLTGWVREVMSLRLFGLVILQLKRVEHFTDKMTKQMFTSSPAHRSFLVFAFAALSGAQMQYLLLPTAASADMVAAYTDALRAKLARGQFDGCRGLGTLAL